MQRIGAMRERIRGAGRAAPACRHRKGVEQQAKPSSGTFLGGVRPLQDWLLQHEVWIGAATVISVVTFVATVAAIPMVIARIPEDYFVREPTPPWPHLSRKLRILLIVLKNLVGAVLLLAGLAMLVLPGQGLLTILVAITLLDFRGKRRLERWIIRQKPVYRVAQWIRTKRNRPPLKLPGRPSQDPSNL